MGVLLGHRKTILKAAADLSAATGGAAAAAPAAEEMEAAPATTEGERRQLTVMFCDLVGSTELSERLDPEDLRGVLRAYQETCAEAVGRFDGHVAKYIGDGVLAYFGYPQAHEDDARRAVSAGLGIVEGLAALNRSHAGGNGVELSVRVGIHTGLVVVGEMGGGATREADAIVGETPNVAARLEGLAEPNSVAISAATERLIEGLFECDDLGPQSLKGVSRPVTVFRIRGESAAPSRFEAAVERGLTPLVGREEEIALLLKRWEQAADGEGQVLLLSGEAGVGKSRIVRGFRERLEAEPHSRILYYGSAYHQNSAFYPVIDQLERALRFTGEDDPEEKLAKLERLLDDLGLPVAEHLPLHAGLISLSTGDRFPLHEMAPQARKQITVEAVAAVYEAMAGQQPVLMVVEDAHWIDPSTLELLSLLIERLRAARLLLLVTFRPEFEAPWADHAHVTAHTLNRLGRKDATAMIAGVTGGKALPDEVLDQIVAKTDGVPLYVEEITKTVLESGVLEETAEGYVLTGPLPPLAIPASLQDSLMARLDRLAPVKEVAQLAAVLGRMFKHDLLAAVTPLDGAALEEALEQLVGAGLVYRRGLAPDALYEFKHALVQDAAYQSLLKSTRQQHHGRIARVLEEQFPDTAETQPELLAYHLTEAGLAEQAVAYWQRAGERAAERSANLEAVASLSKGIELLAALPERAERELALQIALGPALLASRGFGDPDIGKTYERARDLAERLGDDASRFTALWGLWIYNLTGEQFRTAEDLSAQLLTAAGRQGDTAFHLQAHHAAWTTDFFRGELTAAIGHAEKGEHYYEPNEHRAHKFLYGGHDPGVCALDNRSLCEWLLGYPDRAIESNERAASLAVEIAHPNSHAQALAFGAIIHYLRREAAAAREKAKATMTLSTEHGLGMWVPIGLGIGGAAWAAKDGRGEALGQLREAIAIFQRAGVGVLGPFFLAALVQVIGDASETYVAAEALGHLADAQAHIDRTGEEWFEAEIHRLRGEVLLKGPTNAMEEAEAAFQHALDISRNQAARALELRAATSLARLWGENKKRAEARDLLAPVYGWFTEGFDTPDLKDAKALLEELS